MRNALVIPCRDVAGAVETAELTLSLRALRDIIVIVAVIRHHIQCDFWPIRRERRKLEALSKMKTTMRIRITI
jgi:hypothetical protein